MFFVDTEGLFSRGASTVSGRVSHYFPDGDDEGQAGGRGESPRRRWRQRLQEERNFVQSAVSPALTAEEGEALLWADETLNGGGNGGGTLRRGGAPLHDDGTGAWQAQVPMLVAASMSAQKGGGEEIDGGPSSSSSPLGRRGRRSRGNSSVRATFPPSSLPHSHSPSQLHLHDLRGRLAAEHRNIRNAFTTALKSGGGAPSAVVKADEVIVAGRRAHVVMTVSAARELLGAVTAATAKPLLGLTKEAFAKLAWSMRAAVVGSEEAKVAHRRAVALANAEGFGGTLDFASPTTHLSSSPAPQTGGGAGGGGGGAGASSSFPSSVQLCAAFHNHLARRARFRYVPPTRRVPRNGDVDGRKGSRMDDRRHRRDVAAHLHAMGYAPTFSSQHAMHALEATFGSARDVLLHGIRDAGAALLSDPSLRIETVAAQHGDVDNGVGGERQHRSGFDYWLEADETAAAVKQQRKSEAADRKGLFDSSSSSSSSSSFAASGSDSDADGWQSQRSPTNGFLSVPLLENYDGDETMRPIPTAMSGDDGSGAEGAANHQRSGRRGAVREKARVLARQYPSLFTKEAALGRAAMIIETRGRVVVANANSNAAPNAIRSSAPAAARPSSFDFSAALLRGSAADDDASGGSGEGVLVLKGAATGRSKSNRRHRPPNHRCSSGAPSASSSNASSCEWSTDEDDFYHVGPRDYAYQPPPPPPPFSAGNGDLSSSPVRAEASIRTAADGGKTARPRRGEADMSDAATPTTLRVHLSDGRHGNGRYKVKRGPTMMHQQHQQQGAPAERFWGPHHHQQQHALFVGEGAFGGSPHRNVLDYSSPQQPRGASSAARNGEDHHYKIPLGLGGASSWQRRRHDDAPRPPPPPPPSSMRTRYLSLLRGALGHPPAATNAGGVGGGGGEEGGVLVVAERFDGDAAPHHHDNSDGAAAATAWRHTQAAAAAVVDQQYRQSEHEQHTTHTAHSAMNAYWPNESSRGGNEKQEEDHFALELKEIDLAIATLDEDRRRRHEVRRRRGQHVGMVGAAAAPRDGSAAKSSRHGSRRPPVVAFNKTFRRLFFNIVSDIFLNSGSYGSTPKCVLRAREMWEMAEQRNPQRWRGDPMSLLVPAASAVRGDGGSSTPIPSSTSFSVDGGVSTTAAPTTTGGSPMLLNLKRVKNQLALLLKTNPADMGLLVNCNGALSTVLKSMPWEAGDSIVLLSCDYDATFLQTQYLEETYGVEVIIIPIAPPMGDEAVCRKINAAFEELYLMTRTTTSTSITIAAAGGGSGSGSGGGDDRVSSGSMTGGSVSVASSGGSSASGDSLSSALASLVREVEATSLAASGGGGRGGGGTARRGGAVDPHLSLFDRARMGEDVVVREGEVPRWAAHRRSASHNGKKGARKGRSGSNSNRRRALTDDEELLEREGVVIHHSNVNGGGRGSSSDDDGDSGGGHASDSKKKRNKPPVFKGRHFTSKHRPTRFPRLFSFSHVTSRHGWIFPARTMTAIAHSYGVLVCADGAQAVGHFAVDLPRLGCDFYMGTGHKWLYTVPGTAFLAVAPAVQDLIQPLATQLSQDEFDCVDHSALAAAAAASPDANADAKSCGGGGAAPMSNTPISSAFTQSPSPSSSPSSLFEERFSISLPQHDVGPFLAMEQSLGFMEEVCGGVGAVMDRGQALATEAVRVLSAMWGLPEDLLWSPHDARHPCHVFPMYGGMEMEEGGAAGGGTDGRPPPLLPLPPRPPSGPAVDHDGFATVEGYRFATEYYESLGTFAPPATVTTLAGSIGEGTASHHRHHRPLRAAIATLWANRDLVGGVDWFSGNPHAAPLSIRGLLEEEYVDVARGNKPSASSSRGGAEEGEGEAKRPHHHHDHHGGRGKASVVADDDLHLYMAADGGDSAAAMIGAQPQPSLPPSSHPSRHHHHHHHLNLTKRQQAMVAPNVFLHYNVTQNALYCEHKATVTMAGAAVIGVSRSTEQQQSGARAPSPTGTTSNNNAAPATASSSSRGSRAAASAARLHRAAGWYRGLKQSVLSDYPLQTVVAPPVVVAIADDGGDDAAHHYDGHMNGCCYASTDPSALIRRRRAVGVGRGDALCEGDGRAAAAGRSLFGADLGSSATANDNASSSVPPFTPTPTPTIAPPIPLRFVPRHDYDRHKPMSSLPLLPLPDSRGCTNADAVKLMGYLLTKGVTVMIVVIDDATIAEGVVGGSSLIDCLRAMDKAKLAAAATTAAAAMRHKMMPVAAPQPRPLLPSAASSAASDTTDQHLLHDSDDGGDTDAIDYSGPPSFVGSAGSGGGGDLNVGVGTTGPPLPQAQRERHHQKQRAARASSSLPPPSPSTYLAVRISCSLVASIEDIEAFGRIIKGMRGGYGALAIVREYLPAFS